MNCIFLFIDEQTSQYNKIFSMAYVVIGILACEMVKDDINELMTFPSRFFTTENLSDQL